MHQDLEDQRHAVRPRPTMAPITVIDKDKSADQILMSK